MDYSKIGPLRPGWGSLYQGGVADPAGLRAIQGPPLWLVCMNHGEVDDSYIDGHPVLGLTVVAIEDSSDATLPDQLVIAGAYADAFVMRSGCGLVAHCAAGVSRSSYRNLATIMLVEHLDFAAALAFLQHHRPQANPNPGFVDQLRKLEAQLLAGQVP
ncbi:MAG: dual specificity protein phosphatase family protein [Chloroflexi bacterium]|nr:dual specificity protein phosphatase family protein [Chloroflexota bacterium]